MRSIVCASAMTTPTVVPSGAARLSMPMPIAPDAPAWFSTTTGWRRLSLNFCPISRALMSPAAPGGLGTMMRIARGGSSCALPASGSKAKAQRSNAQGWERRVTPWPRRNSGGAPLPTLHRSRALIRITIEAANDVGHARLRPNQMITAVAIATQASSLPQLIQGAGDLTSVIAADRVDDVGVKHRRRCERLLDGLEAGGAAEDLGRASRQRNFAFPAERLGAVESRLGPGPPPVERGVHGHPKHSLQDDEILIGLEARPERPFDLPIIVNVDVLVEHVNVLEPHDSAEQRGDGHPSFADDARLDRDAQRVRTARYRPQIDRDRLAHRGLEDLHCLGLGAHCSDVGAVRLVQDERGAVQQRVMERVAAHGDRGAMKYRVHVDRPVVAHVFAVGAFRLRIAALVEIAFERHLRVCRH